MDWAQCQQSARTAGNERRCPVRAHPASRQRRANSQQALPRWQRTLSAAPRTRACTGSASSRAPTRRTRGCPAPGREQSMAGGVRQKLGRCGGSSGWKVGQPHQPSETPRHACPSWGEGGPSCTILVRKRGHACPHCLPTLPTRTAYHPPPSPTVLSRLTADFWMNTRPMSRAICLRVSPTCSRRAAGRDAWRVLWRRQAVARAAVHLCDLQQQVPVHQAHRHSSRQPAARIATALRPHLPHGRQRLGQVLGVLHNLNHPLLVAAMKGGCAGQRAGVRQSATGVCRGSVSTRQAGSTLLASAGSPASPLPLHSQPPHSHAELGRLRQGVRDGQLDEVVVP